MKMFSSAPRPYKLFKQRWKINSSRDGSISGQYMNWKLSIKRAALFAAMASARSLPINDMFHTVVDELEFPLRLDAPNSSLASQTLPKSSQQVSSRSCIQKSRVLKTFGVRNQVQTYTLAQTKKKKNPNLNRVESYHAKNRHKWQINLLCHWCGLKARLVVAVRKDKHLFGLVPSFKWWVSQFIQYTMRDFCQNSLKHVLVRHGTLIQIQGHLADK